MFINLTIIKNKIAFLFLVLLLSALNSNAQWNWLHPSPQGNDLHATSFPTATIGWAGGAGGAVLKTVDGGDTWAQQNCGYFNNISGIYFPTTSIGYLAQSNNFLKTISGGTSWNAIYRYSNLYVETMYFLNADTGWVAGVFNGFYSIQQTLDGGNTWQIQTSSLTKKINSIQVNPNGFGWAAGESGLYMQTSDYGTNWTPSSPIGSTTINAIHFPTNLDGFMVGDAGAIYITSDGGLTWNPSINPAGGSNLKSVNFSSSTVGIAAGENGTILYTSNGGVLWQIINQPTWFTGNSAVRINATDVIIVGSYGEILKSVNNGSSWISKQIRISDKNLSGVCASSATALFAAGDNGTILKSVNSGLSWQLLNTGTTYKFNDIASLSTINITAVGDGGSIFNSTNGGNTWGIKASPTTDDLYSICKASPTRMFACGNNDAIFISNNSGVSWQALSTPLSGAGYKYLDVFFISADTGWIATDGSEILHTVDGGANWNITSTSFTAEINSISFINSLQGWACTQYGDILETNDGGLNFQLLFSKNGGQFDKIIFTDAQNGWVFGEGKVIRSADGGISWSDEYLPSSQFINDAVFLNGNEAIAVGNGLSSIIGRSGDLKIFISDTLLCTDNFYTTTVNSTGTFNAGNVFTVQISDEFGNFNFPITIGSINSTISTPILINVPQGLTDALGYRIRVTSTNPPIYSPVNSFPLTLKTSPDAYAYTLTPTAFCQWDSVTIYANYSSAWTYKWFKNSIPIVGALTDSITVNQTGDYTVNVSDGICDYTSSIVDVLVFNCVGIDEVNANLNYHAYPNPTNGIITIDWNKDVSVNEILLKDITGRTLRTITNVIGKKQVIDLSNLQSGIYFITTSGNSAATIKVIKY